LASSGKKTQKKLQEVLMRAIKSAFWMELNMALKILAFCIPPFQNSLQESAWDPIESESKSTKA
jgi:hypothetical protein